MEGVSFQIVAHWCAFMEKPLSHKNGYISRNEDQCFFFFTRRKHDNTWPSKKKKDHSCLKCVKQTSGMRREGESKVWFNSPFSLIGRVGNTYPFCALHWDSGRFMLMNAPDSTIWPLQGNSGSTMEAQFCHLASRTTFAIRKRKIRKRWFLQKYSTLTTLLAFEIDLRCRFHNFDLSNTHKIS